MYAVQRAAAEQIASTGACCALAAKGYGVLTTTGRKTGKPRLKCVRVIRRGDRAYLVALRPPHLAVQHPNATQAWVWNIRAYSRVRLRIRGGIFDGIAREITDNAELEQARAAICDPVYRGDFGECSRIYVACLPARKFKSCTTTGSTLVFRSRSI